nr:hypothetical protein GCM10017745_49170 [Saccharothrix mutabilis subsp. capreolus]
MDRETRDTRLRAVPPTDPRHVVQEAALLVAVALLLFLGYQDWGKAATIGDRQSALDRELRARWDGSATAGAALPGRLHIPALELRLVVVEGVDRADLDHAPGHYPRSAAPGERGNTAIAGNRTKGLFRDLDELRTGDPMVFETATEWLVYAVHEVRIAHRADADALAPVPDLPGRSRRPRC